MLLWLTCLVLSYLFLGAKIISRLPMPPLRGFTGAMLGPLHFDCMAALWHPAIAALVHPCTSDAGGRATHGAVAETQPTFLVKQYGNVVVRYALKSSLNEPLMISNSF